MLTFGAVKKVEPDWACFCLHGSSKHLLVYSGRVLNPEDAGVEACIRRQHCQHMVCCRCSLWLLCVRHSLHVNIHTVFSNHKWSHQRRWRP